MKNVKHVNPDGLMKSPAFSQAIVVQGNGRQVYIGGQNAVNAKGELVGKGDLQAQTEQVMKNIDIALHACGGSFKNLLKFSVYIVEGQNATLAFQAAQKFLQKLSAPPVVTTLYVAALGNPDYLLEVDAVAYVPE